MTINNTTLNKLISKYNAKEWVKPGSHEIRYYVDWKAVTGQNPQTSSQRLTKIWFSKNGELNVEGKIGCVEHITRIIAETVKELEVA